MASHAEKVARLCEAIRRRRARRDGFASLDKTAPSHFVPNPHDPRHADEKISVRDLDALLAIDRETRRAVAEPGLTFSRLVRVTLAHGLVPKLVPELEGITVGGAVAGCSVESMSHQYGGFHDSCLRYEVVTGTGDVLSCSRERDPLLFEMIHGSYGTLGILTELEFELVPAKPFVHLEYRRAASFEEFWAALLEHANHHDWDFVDAIVHGPRSFVLCLGRFVDHAERTSRYTFLDIFWKSTLAKREDTLTTYDYFFRYDTECHWLTRTLPGLEWKPVRFLVGRWLLGSTNLLTWARRLRPVLKHVRRPDVVVDVFIPAEHGAEFWRWYEKTVDFYPLWVVPYRLPRGTYPWVADAHAARARGDLFVDFAVYGRRNDTPGVDYYALLEDETWRLGGLKTLISHNRYAEDRFWSIYHRANYDAVKRRTDPDNLFRGLYEKFHFGSSAAARAVDAPDARAAG